MTDPRHLRDGRVLLVLALLSGAALMAPMRTAGPLVLDEHGSYWIVDSGIPSTALERSLGYAAIPPLSGWTQQAFLSAGGRSEAAFRASSAVAFLLAIVFAYLAARVLGGPLAGGLAAVVLAWHPEAMDEARIARCYGLVLLTAALLLWITARWVRAIHAEQGRSLEGNESPLRPLGWSVAWGAGAAALAWTHYMAAPLAGFALLTPLACALRTCAARRAALLSVAAAVGVAAVLVSPLLPAVWRIWEWSPFLNYQREPGGFWRAVGPLWWAGAPAGLLAAWGLARATEPSKGTGRRADVARPRQVDGAVVRGEIAERRPSHPTLNSRSTRNSALLLASCSLLPVMLIALVAQGDLTSLANPRYRVAYAVPAACLIAVLTTWCARRPALACAGVAVALAAAWGAAGRHPWQLGRLGSLDALEWRRAAEIIGQQGRGGEPLFVQSGLVEASLVSAFYSDPLFMEYMACRLSRFYLEAPHPRYGLPYLWEASPEMRADLAGLLVRNCAGPRADVWLACATDTDLNQRSLAGAQRLLAEHGYKPRDEWPFETLALIRYVCPEDQTSAGR